MGETGKHVFVFFVHAAARGGTCTFTLKIASALIRRAHVTIDLRSRHREQPASCRARPMNVDDLEDIRWIRVVGGERWPAASYTVLPNLKKDLFLFFAIGEGLRFFVVCFLYTGGHIFLYQTPGRRPPRITSRVVNTAVVTTQWVGAPNEHTSFRIHYAVVGFVDRCLSRTRNLDASNLTFGLVFLRPILAQHLSRKQNVETFFFEDLCS